MILTLTEIDALLAEEKSLFGNVEWVEDGANAKLRSSIVNSAGVVIGALTFVASVNINTAIQRGTCALILENRPLQRISYLPSAPHKNTGAHPIPLELRFRTLPADQTRHYLWEDNRIWPRTDNIGAGRLVSPQPRTFMDAMQLFLEACGITAYVTDPPHRPTLEF